MLCSERACPALSAGLFPEQSTGRGGERYLLVQRYKQALGGKT